MYLFVQELLETFSLAASEAERKGKLDRHTCLDLVRTYKASLGSYTYLTHVE